MQDRKKLTKLIILISAIVAIVGCFLPYYTVSAFGMTESINYVGNNGGGADGILVIIAVGVSVALTFLKEGKLQKFSTITSGIALAITLYDWFDVKNTMSGFGMDLGSFGIGAYLVLLGTIVAVVGGILSFVWKVGSDDNNDVINNANDNMNF